MKLVNSFNRIFAIAICFGLVLGISTNVSAQNLPSGKEVLEKFVKATGGIDKYKKIKSMTMKGKLSVPAQNISAEMEMAYSAPDKFFTKVDLGGIGSESQGSNGKIVWATSTIQGDRIVKGEEADRLLESVNMKSIFEPESIYKEMKTVGKEKVDGEECYKVEMVRKKGGDKDVAFFSIKSGLQLKSVTKAISPLGKIEVSVLSKDYKDVDGIMTPHKMEQSMSGISINIEVSSVKFNAKVDESNFEVPASIQKLADKDKN